MITELYRDCDSFDVIASSTNDTFLLPITRTHIISVLTVRFPSCSQIPMGHAPSNSGIAPLLVAAAYSGVYGVSVSENTYNKELILHTILWAVTESGAISGFDLCLIARSLAQYSNVSAFWYFSYQCWFNIPVVTIGLYFLFCCCIYVRCSFYHELKLASNYLLLKYKMLVIIMNEAIQQLSSLSAVQHR